MGGSSISGGGVTLPCNVTVPVTSALTSATTSPLVLSVTEPATCRFTSSFLPLSDMALFLEHVVVGPFERQQSDVGPTAHRLIDLVVPQILIDPQARHRPQPGGRITFDL